MGAVLTVNNLSVVYKNKDKKIRAVDRADLCIQSGDSLGIVGESGSGKSTLAMAILRLLPSHVAEVSGEIDFLGRPLLDMKEDDLRKIRWKELSVVFQKSMNCLSPVHRIGEQISDIYRIHEPNATKEQIRARIDELFSLVNLSGRTVRLYPHELSGGMLQRVSIAVGLIHNPRLLIMDEATTALDVVTQGQILDEIKQMGKKLEITRVMITHDMSVVASSCARVAVMYAGDIVETGPCVQVLKQPKHPYTTALIASFPVLRGEKKKLKAIGGHLPDLSMEHNSCLFAPRCPHSCEACLHAKPAMIQVGDDWMASCVLHGGARE
jgi:peptide/nickel transport system ATP-binding protein